MVANNIDAQAVLWAVRFERGLEPCEVAALEAWLQADVRHVGAYARARSVAMDSLRLRALGQEAANSPSAHIQHAQETSRRGAIAAAMVLMMGGIGAGAALVRREQSYRTGLGEVREVVLEDGTVLTLSALSSVSVRMNDTSRDVVIAAGEALLEVSPSSRPLRILAAGATVEAAAGRVLVRRYAQDPLNVTALDQPITVSRGERRMVVDAGERMDMSRQPVRKTLGSEDVARALAWREGQLALHDDYLRTAAASFARFSPVKLELEGSEVENLRITGLFDVRDPVSFARAAALSLNLRVQADDLAVKLYKK